MSICVSNSILKGPEAGWGPGEVTWSTFGPVFGGCASLAVLPFAVVVTLSSCPWVCGSFRLRSDEEIILKFPVFPS